MSFSIRIDPSTQVALAVISGPCDAEVSRKALSELWNSKEWNGQGVVWDVREATIEGSVDDIRSVAQFLLTHQPANPPSRVAFVTGDDFSFGTMRMFEVYREDPRTETKVLRDLDQAIAWVTGGAAD